MQMTTRRHFMQSCSVGLAAGLPISTLGAEPIPRNGESKFKLSLAAYSYRNLLKSGELTLSDFITDCAKMQLDGTELTSYYFPTPTTPEYLRQLKGECFRAGLSVSGTAVGNDFGHPAGEAREKQIADLKQWIDKAEILGAPVIRVFAGHKKEGISQEETHRLMVAGLEDCCEYAGEHGIYLALENHGGPTSTATGLLKLVKDVQSPWLGVNLDTGNFHSEDIYGELEEAAPYAVNVQVKVVIYGPDKVRMPTDFNRLAKILDGAGYRGFIVLEYEEEGDPRVECPKYIEQLKEVFV